MVILQEDNTSQTERWIKKENAYVLPKTSNKCDKTQIFLEKIQKEKGKLNLTMLKIEISINFI